jgi:hypothetical protein
MQLHQQGLGDRRSVLFDFSHVPRHGLFPADDRRKPSLSSHPFWHIQGFFPMATMEQPADTEAALFASIPKTSQVCGFITSSRARKTAKYCYHKLVAGLCGINEEDGSDDDDNVDS